ncbi:MAG: ABC transporter substrate-binding protein [Gammaproteobacteria bacterium]|nr:ABC transporter substrate-binding protein [Gammaproteobacteria bacterium]
MWMAVLLFLLVSCLTSCNNDTSHDSLRFGLASAPITLDPRFATDAVSARINRLLYRRLVDFDSVSLPVPELASWEVVTARHYRFTLGEAGRQFVNGQRLIAADVKATYDSILDEKNASPHRGALALISRIDAPDDNTVDFYLTKEDMLFPGRLTIGILPRQQIAAGHPFNREPLGSGYFKFIDWPQAGQLRLLRIADQQQVEFIHVKDPTVRVLKLLRGEIDMLQNNLPSELVAYLSNQEKEQLQIIKSQGSNFTYLGFNMADAVVGRAEVREAIAHAIDREAIIKYLWAGAARTAEALLPAQHWAGNSHLQPYEYNPDKARQMIKALGYDARKPLVISYKTSNDPFRIRLATVIQSQLADVGIKVELSSYDWGTFYGDIKAGRFQMYSLSWVGIKSPDIFRYVFHSSAVPPSGANRGRYNSARADEFIEEAEGSASLIFQTWQYQMLQDHLHEELPYVPLWYEDHIFIARSDINGYRVSVDGNYDGLIRAKRIAP